MPNSALTTSGAPAAIVTAGSAYSFIPTVADPDGQALTYSTPNKPPCAAFSAYTGRLSGTHTSTNVGTTSGIVITVSDGKTTTSLPSFTITVWPVAATGSALTDLVGFRVYLGTSSAALAEDDGPHFASLVYRLGLVLPGVDFLGN